MICHWLQMAERAVWDDSERRAPGQSLGPLGRCAQVHLKAYKLCFQGSRAPCLVCPQELALIW